MGWLKERAGRGGLQYTAMYRDLQDRERSAGTFSNKREANKAWQKAEADLDAGRRQGDPKKRRQRLVRYVEDEWFPHHRLEATGRENYRNILNRHVLPEFGEVRLGDVRPLDVRRWLLRMEAQDVGAPTIDKAKTVFDAIYTTALNDQIVSIHPGRGVKKPPAPRKLKQGMTVEQFDAIYKALPDTGGMRLLVETNIETGLRWGELTELRPRDFDAVACELIIARAVVELKAKNRPDGVKFIVKDYPKDEELRRVKIASHMGQKFASHIAADGLGPDDLLFSMPQPNGPARRTRPAELPNPETLGMTQPNDRGRQYRHGSLSGYQLGKCRCQRCKDGMAVYRAERRAEGRDGGSRPRVVASDGHISGDWFRKQVWAKALKAADLEAHFTPNDMRHANASWLLAGGADLQVVKERLGHGSIRTTDRYLHALPSAQNQALRALDVMRGRRGVDDFAEAPDAGESTVEASESDGDPGDAEIARLRLRLTS